MPPKQKKGPFGSKQYTPPRKAAPKRPSPTPRIDRMQNQGLTKDQILDRLNGKNDQRDLTRQQLKAIGYVDSRINRILRNQRQGDNTTGGSRQGGNGQGSGVDEYPAMPEADPYSPYDDWIEQQQETQRQSAFAMMQSLLDQYGLSDLSPFLQDLISNGNTDPATLQLELQNTDTWKKRFRGNELLRQQGLGVLSPAEYLNLERSYASVMRQFGLPPGFYDTTEDFVNFIGGNVSPQELADRANMAMDLAKQVDPTQREALRSMYGIGEGDIAAYFLDAKKATPILQKQVQAVKIAGAGSRAGLAVGADRAKFEDMADRGVTEQMAQQGYGLIANEIDPLKNLASIWGRGNDWTLDEAEQATFFNDATAQRERKGLISQERAAFSGRSGFQSGVSGRRSSAGSF